MKKVLLILLLSAVSLCSEATTDEHIEKWKSGEYDGEHCLRVGELFPISLEFTGDAVDICIKDGTICLIPKQDTYFQIDRENITFSLDGESWHTFEELFKGNLSLFAGVREKTFGGIKLDLNNR